MIPQASGFISTPLAGNSLRLPTQSSAWSSKSTDELLGQHSEAVNRLRDASAEAIGRAESLSPANSLPLDDIFLLRHVLDASEAAASKKGDSIDVDSTCLESVRFALDWRCGEGKSIVDSAAEAVKAATANGGWDNDEIFTRAPHADKVAPFISPKGTQFLTLTGAGAADAPFLIKVIRAGAIDDKGLMAAVTTDQMVEFFLYASEVNALAADAMTRKSGTLVKVATANDLGSVDLLGDATFRTALSAASKKANDVHPSLAGPTILLNLPALLGALVSLFKPLFPPAVQRKLKFAQGPLSKVGDLTELATVPATKAAFLKEVNDLLD